MSAPPGSPEAVKEQLARLEAAEAEARAKAEAGAAGDESEGGDEAVTLTKKEHDALQAKLRILEKAERDRKAEQRAAEKAAAEKAAKKRLEAAEAAGVGMELREAQAKAEEKEAELRELRTERAIERVLRSRRWTDEAKELAVSQITSAGFEGLEADEASGVPTEEALNKALDDLAERYPSTFNVQARSRDDAKEPTVTRAKRTPSTPTLAEQSGSAKFEGYISPEDFMRISQVERQQPDYMERLQKSMKLWPDLFNHRNLREG